MIYRVRVKATGQRPNKRAGKQPVNAVWRAEVLIEAEDFDTAMVRAEQYADSILPSNAKWADLTALSASLIVFPFTLAAT